MRHFVVSSTHIFVKKGTRSFFFKVLTEDETKFIRLATWCKYFLLVWSVSALAGLPPLHELSFLRSRLPLPPAGHLRDTISKNSQIIILRAKRFNVAYLCCSP